MNKRTMRLAVGLGGLLGTTARYNEIEREHDKYEVKAKNRDGRTVGLYLGPSTGTTLEAEEEDDD